MFIRVIIYFVLVTVVTIFVTGAVSYNEMTKDAKATAETYMTNELNELYRKYDEATTAVSILTELNNKSMLARARAAASAILFNPSLLEDQEALHALGNDLGAESIMVCDEEGNILHSAPMVHISAATLTPIEKGSGQNQDVNTALRRTLHKLSVCAKGRVYSRTLLASAQDNSGRQERYACVRRKDAPGIVVLSFYLEHEGMARKLSDVEDLVNNASVGDKGMLFAFDGGQPYVSDSGDLPASEAELRALPLNVLLEEEYDHVEYFVYAMKRNNLRLIAMVPSSEYYSGRARSTALHLYSGCTLLLALILSAYFLMRRYTLKPLEELDVSMRRIGEGKYDERVHLSTTPEFRRLAQSINIMLDSIRCANDLSAEQNQKELALARSIKDAVLPKAEDVLAGRKDFDLSINLVQADTVGGDFYDCLMTDEDHLLIVLGSIAEQGVPAALYMMRGLSIIRNYIGETEDQEPKELVSKINYHICKGDSTNIRVAMLIALMQISTGEVVCVNAGQHAPMLQRPGEQFEEIRVPVSPILGKNSNATYKQYSFVMEPGDRLFICTNSLTSMENETKELFGEQRLHQALGEAAPTIRDVPHLVRTAVRRFIRQAERTKDYTMISLELPGVRHSGGSIVVAAGESHKALQMVEQALEEVFAAPNDINAILEATSTIMSAIPAETQVRVMLGCTENHARVTLTYNGEEKDILQDLPELPAGTASYHHAANINDIILHTTLG